MKLRESAERIQTPQEADAYLDTMLGARTDESLPVPTTGEIQAPLIGSFDWPYGAEMPAEQVHKVQECLAAILKTKRA